MKDKRPFVLRDPPSISDFCRRGSLREKNDAHAAPFPSIDLILLSGVVREAGYQPRYIDAQLDRIDWAGLRERLSSDGAAGVVSLVSSARIEEELAELRAVKEALDGGPIYIVGPIILQRERSRIEHILGQNPWLDGIILNTAEHNLGELLGGATAPPINVALNRGGVIIPDLKVRYGDSLRIPQPQHSIFRDSRYCLPQSRRGPVTCAQFSFGCPFTCEFCIDNQLYRKMLYRDVDDMVAEMVEIDRLGFREVYFKDLTFGLSKAIATEFLRKLAAAKLRVRWLCTTRIDVAGRDMLELMKQAGCYGIEFGVEHANESTRRRIDKRIKDERIREVFADCRKMGLETTAFIMLAFEDDTEQDVLNTIRFARSLRPNYVSFNVVNALPGTAYEERARREGFLREGPSDYGFATSNIKHRHLSPDQVERLRRKALRSFYLHPPALLQRLLDVRSLFELRKLVRLGLGTL